MTINFEDKERAIERERRAIEDERVRLAERQKALEQEETDNRELAAKMKYENDPRIPIAIQLHTLMCNHNHIDGCSWSYESKWHDWNIGWARKEYLKKATRVVDMANKLGIKPEDALEIIKAVKG
jgi:hypothetical protein